MPRATRILALLAAAAAAALVAAPAASADFEELYEQYRSFGVIEGCANPESELRDALEAIPADIRAYDPGFEDALNGALEQRAVGCTGSDPFRNDQTTDPGVTSADDGSPGPANPAPVPFEPSGPEPGIPIAVIALIAALGGALLLAVGLAGGRAVGLAAPRAPGALGRHLRRLGELAADSLWVLRRRLGL